MNQSHKEMFSIGLTLAIIAMAVFIIHRFIPSMLWASVVVIATYPLYKRWRKLFCGRDNLAAFLFTSVLTLILVIPVTWLVTVIVHEVQLLINYLHHLNRDGEKAPELLQKLPFFSQEIVNYWNANISQPGNVKYWLSNLHISLAPASYYIKQVGLDIVQRGFQLGFTLLSLFFFFRDGDALFKQINLIGEVCLGRRWFRYADKLPSALRSTVNGTIAVGLGVGILMGLCYALVGCPGPTLLGFFTAVAAMIPFAVPFVFLIVALILCSYSSFVGALIVVIWGTIVMFVADHFIKPVLIGGAIQLPFLAVLFGILGGVETLGILGLFVGPIIMVLFITLWMETQSEPETK